VQKGLEGKQKEADMSRGHVSKSERQARLEKEQEDMMSKIRKVRKSEFDNTKRIERPEEVLERRRLDRENRNRWYRRTWRYVTGQK